MLGSPKGLRSVRVANQNNTMGWGQPLSYSQQGSAGLKLVGGLVRADSWDHLSLTNELE